VVKGQGLVNWSSRILKDKDLRLDDKDLSSKDKGLKSEDKDKDL